MKKKINQQGTLQRDSSEAISSNSNKDAVLFKEIVLPDQSFINWFLGFCEGHENIFLVNRRYLRFELNSTLNNGDILYLIKKKLKFGKIKKIRFLDGIIVEFSVQTDINGLIVLTHIFNGNLRCTQKEQHFRIFYNKLKVKLKKMNLLSLLPDYICKVKDINLLNSWLCGFIDSRCLLYGRFQKSKKLKEGKRLYIVIFFWSLSDQLLNKIKDSLNLVGKIEKKEKWNLPFFKLTLENFDDKVKIINYLSTFKLKSLKIEKYKYFKILLRLESIYIKTGVQDFEKIEKILKKLTSRSSENELIKL